MEKSEIRRIRELEKENVELKKALGEHVIMLNATLTRLVFLVQWKVSLISPSFCLIQGADVAKRSQFPERIPPVFCR